MSNNKWVLHVKKFAKDNNLSYGCAISNKQCKETYNKVSKKTNKEKQKEKYEQVTNSIINGLIQKIKNSTNLDNDRPTLIMRYNTLSPQIKARFNEKYKKYFDMLFP